MRFARRVTLIHATPVAVQPVADSFHRLWPEASLMNLLDDSLSSDLAARGSVDGALTQRFVDLAQYAERTGTHGILFTCSAFGVAIDAAAQAVAVPAYKPNEAMFLEALEIARARRGRAQVGLLSTFAPSIPSMREEFLQLARAGEVAVELQAVCATGALEALSAGDPATHDRLVVEEAASLENCDVVMLGQFSMARSHEVVSARLQRPVLTSPDSAVRLLQKILSPA